MAPKQLTKLETRQLDDWISNQFQTAPIPPSFEQVSTLDLLKSQQIQAQLTRACFGDGILTRCRSHYLHVLKNRFDEHSVGSVSLIFLPSNLLDNAFQDAQRHAVDLCKKLCTDSEYKKITINWMTNKLVKFSQMALNKVTMINGSNCAGYYEKVCQTEFTKGKGNIDEFVRTAEWLGEITNEQLKGHVDLYFERVNWKMTKLLGAVPQCPYRKEWEELSIAKGDELQKYGENLVAMETEKEFEEMHCQAVVAIKQIFEKQRERRRLNTTVAAYEHQVLQALEHAKDEYISLLGA